MKIKFAVLFGFIPFLFWSCKKDKPGDAKPDQTCTVALSENFFKGNKGNGEAYLYSSNKLVEYYIIDSNGFKKPKSEIKITYSGDKIIMASFLADLNGKGIRNYIYDNFGKILYINDNREDDLYKSFSSLYFHYNTQGFCDYITNIGYSIFELDTQSFVRDSLVFSDFTPLGRPKIKDEYHSNVKEGKFINTYTHLFEYDVNENCTKVSQINHSKQKQFLITTSEYDTKHNINPEYINYLEAMRLIWYGISSFDPIPNRGMSYKNPLKKETRYSSSGDIASVKEFTNIVDAGGKLTEIEQKYSSQISSSIISSRKYTYTCK